MRRDSTPSTSVGDAGAGRAGEHRFDVGERADHRGLAGRAGEVAGRDDLRQHRARGELARRARRAARPDAPRRSRAGRACRNRRYAAGASVAMTSMSASRSRASSALAWSLSITASTPTSCRPTAYAVGMPPPPAQMTTQPCSSSQRIWPLLEDPLRRGRRHDAAHGVAVGLERPAPLGGERRPPRRRRRADRSASSDRRTRDRRDRPRSS